MAKILISENIFNETYSNFFLLEDNQYNKLITLKKPTVDKIRLKNSKLNKILKNTIFNEKKIYIKGGVARLALELFSKKTRIDIQIRDIDYCYIGDYSEFLNIKDQHNIDITFEGSSLKGYFDSRDVSFNEILLRPDMLIFTRRAYRDYKKEIINPLTKNLDDRRMARTLLFAARYNYQIPEPIKFTGDLNSFEFLVCLLKAYELNIEKKYFNICKKYKLTKNAKSHIDWLIRLLEDEKLFNLYGRENLIVKDFVNYDDQKKLEYLYKRFPALKKNVERLEFDDPDFFLHFLRKPNRYKKNVKNYK